MKRTKQPANTYDSGMTGPRDSHRAWPALPFVLLGVMLLILLLLACEWVGFF